MLNSPIYELEKITSNDQTLISQGGGPVLSPDHFTYTDQYHDMLTKETLSVRDKKSKQIRG